jgi:hypothetical protein
MIRLIAITSLLLLGSCWQSNRGELKGEETAAPDDFSFLGATAPCYLEVQQTRTIRVNCFHIDGNLHIHSNRFAKLPRIRGESWVTTVRREPYVRVAIADNVYRLKAMAIDDSDLRETILHDRGYLYAWDGITIFRFTPE